MFGIGFGELIIIFIIALIVLGPKRLPEVAKTVAKVYREVMGVVNDVKSTVVDETNKNISNTYIPPYNHEFKTEDFVKNSEEKKDNKGQKGDNNKLGENKNLNDYEPKREKISFKKESGDLKNDKQYKQS